MNYWTRFVTRVAVRRVVVLLVLAVLGWAGVGRAEAVTRQQASEACEAGAAHAATDTSRRATGVTDCRAIVSSPTAGRYECTYEADPFNNGNIHFIPCGNVPPSINTYPWNEGCPAGTEWDEESKTCHDPSRCLAKPALGKSIIPGGGFAACVDGCAFEAPPGSGTEISFGEIGTADAVGISTGYKPTGAACAAGLPSPVSDAPICTPSGSGQTSCVNPDGKICHSASTGREICWDPGETGEKTDANMLQKTNAGDQVVPPKNINLESGDTLVQDGTPTKTTATKNGSTSTTTTTNYSTAFGTNAGSGNQGQGTGTGSGSGSGSGDGDGDGEGGTGEGVGKLYEGSGKTVESVMSSFRTEALNTPMFSAVSGFMSDCAFGGSCPVWSYDGGQYMGKVTFDAMCSGALQTLFNYASYIVMALGAFAAFRIAVY